MTRALSRWSAVDRAAPWLGLAALLLCTLGIVSGWGRSETARSGASTPATVRAQSSNRTRPAPMKPQAPAHRSAAARLPVEPFVNLFPSQNWAPPPPPPPQASNAPPAPAQPPPLPFSIGALWLDGSGEFYAVLNSQGREFPMCAACRQSGFYREGDVVLGSYRIEKLTRHEVRFLYLPMKRRQQLSLGG